MQPAGRSLQRPFRHILWRSLAVPVVLLAVAALLLSWTITTLLDDARLDRDGDRVISTANQALRHAVDMETGVRGYQLTGRTELLQPYVDGVQEFERSTRELEQLVARDTARTAQLAAIRNAHAEWYALARELIRRRETGQDVSGYPLNAEASARFDAFRAHVAQFVAVQEREQAARESTLARLEQRVLRFRFLLLTGLGGLIGAFAWWQLTQVARMFQQTEAEARTRAEMLQAILRSIADGVVATGADGRITFMNTTAATLTDWNAADATGRSLDEVVQLRDEASGQSIPTPVTDVIARQRVVDLPGPIAVESQQRRRTPVRFRMAPLQGDNGSQAGAIAVFHDISGERAAATTRVQLATLVESSFEAIIGLEPGGRITEWNHGAEQLFGYTAAEMRGQPLARLIPSDRQAEADEILARAREGKATVARTTVRRHQSGALLDVSVTTSPLRDGDGRVVGLAKVVHDVSALTRTMAELRAAEQSLLAARDDLERKVEERTHELSRALAKAQEVDRLKSEFLATMSHELRTPLNSVIGFTEIILAGIPGPINSEQRHQLGIALTSARHLLHLINDLLDLARIESGRFEPTWELFSPAQVVQEVIGMMHPLADRKNLQLTTDIQLPDQIGSDRKIFLQVLLNLVNNAVKFTEKGRIHVRAQLRSGMIVAEVSDTGIGLKPEQMGMLFEAFRQVDGTSRRRYEGTGLGLHLCRRLLRFLGGEIHAESRYGVGSTFSFSFPDEPERCS